MTTVNRDQRLREIQTELTRNAALSELYKREEAEAAERARVMAASRQHALELLEQATAALSPARPLYARAHAWLLNGAGDLAELYQLAMQINAIESSVSVDMASRLAQRSPAQLVSEIRDAAGLPISRDYVPPGTPEICRVVWRGFCNGLITSDGIGHPQMHGFIKF